MSGLEAIGIAASLIQVAELGTKLSVKLFSFYRELKGDNESIQDLSNDVAITSAILYELGESLKEDEQAKLYSKKAFGFLQDVLNQCEEVIQQIRDLTKYNENTEKTRLQQITDMFRQVILEPRLDPLKASLKRLKSRMLLLLNVIMYAGQLRSNNSPKMLQEQRDFIKVLLEEEQKTKMPAPTISHPVTINMSTDSQMITLKNRDIKDQSPKNDKPSDLDEYSLLMQRMLQEINSCKSRLRESRYSRIKSGVLNIHSREILQFQLDHGQSILQHFDNSLFTEDILDDSNEISSETEGEKDEDRNMSERRKHMAGAGLAGAAVAGIVKVRSHSRSRKGERSRSRSRLRQALPIVGAGLATAAATGLYENKKGEKDEKESSHRGRHCSRSRSRAPLQSYPDPARDSAGLIEYGNDPVAGSIPAEHYYGQPGSSQPYLEGPESYGARRQTRSRSRGGRYSSSSDSDEEYFPRNERDRSRHRRHREIDRDHHTKPQESGSLTTMGLGTAILGGRDSDEENFHRHRRSHRRRRRHHESDRDHQYGDHHTKPQENGSLTAMGLGTAALGGGYSDVEDFEHHRPPMGARRGRRRRMVSNASQTPFMEKATDETETLEMLVLQWTNLRPEEIPAL